MWSGWTCIVIRPYGGGGVSESAWRRLNYSKQSFLSMGTPLGQTRFKCGSVLSLAEADFNPDMTHGFWSQPFISFEIPFYVFCFFIFTSFGCYTFLWFSSSLWWYKLNLACFFSFFWIMILIFCFCSPLYFKSLIVLSFLVLMLHQRKRKTDHILNGVQTLKLISWIVFWWSSVTLCSFCIKNMNWKSWSKYQAIFLL